MAARRKIWDLEAEGGPREIEMFAVAAADALKFDPKRYSDTAPGATKAKPAPEVADDPQPNKKKPGPPEAERRTPTPKAGKPKKVPGQKSDNTEGGAPAA